MTRVSVALRAITSYSTQTSNFKALYTSQRSSLKRIPCQVRNASDLCGNPQTYSQAISCLTARAGADESPLTRGNPLREIVFQPSFPGEAQTNKGGGCAGCENVRPRLACQCAALTKVGENARRVDPTLKLCVCVCVCLFVLVSCLFLISRHRAFTRKGRSLAVG